MHTSAEVTYYDVALLERDMKLHGWLPIDLARAARVSHMTVSRFLKGQRQTARTAKKLADALGTDLQTYVQGGPAVPAQSTSTVDEADLPMLPFGKAAAR